MRLLTIVPCRSAPRQWPVLPPLPQTGICLHPGCGWCATGPGWAVAAHEHARTCCHTTIWRADVGTEPPEVDCHGA